MLCNECNQREATIHLIQITGDETSKRDLCEVCGKDFTVGLSLENLAKSLMTPPDSRENQLDDVAALDPRYPKDAYLFVLDTVNIASLRHFQASSAWQPRHVSGAELLEALRLQAIEKFGASAKTQLNSWGIFKCEDFGEIVYNLIAGGLLGKRPQEKKEDFSGGCDFDSAFPS
jgi:uncharacterized repeat protein (TIGR04138 family)